MSVNVPPGLAARFRVIEELPTQGADANVLRVEDVATGELRVLKLYRPGVKLDAGTVKVLLDMGADAEGRRHTVVLHEADREEGLWYEVQELCSHGSLRTVLQHGPVDPRTLVTQLVPALQFLHDRGIRHRDIKPENLLVRAVDPVDVVLADFGLARDLGEASVRYTVGGTPAYQPPEAGRNQLTSAWDWWSLGMVVAEVALGRHPLAGADRVLPPYQQIPNLVQAHPVDLSGIANERLRDLCRGLLVRDPALRWQGEQALAWVAGDDPAVPDDIADDVADDVDPAPAEAGGAEAPGAQDTAASPTLTVSFGGAEHRDARALAAAFQARWSHASERLFQNRDPQWIAGVEAFLREQGRGEAAQIVARGLGIASGPPAAMAFLLFEMDNDLEPVFDGLRLTPAGLGEAAAAVLRGQGDGRLLSEVRTAQILTLWQSLPGMTDHAARIDRPWQEGCNLIERLVYDARARGAPLDRAAEERAGAYLLLALLDPAQREPELRSHVDQSRRSQAAETVWWRAIADQGLQSLPAAALASVTAQQASELAAEAARAQAYTQAQAQVAAAAGPAPGPAAPPAYAGNAGYAARRWPVLAYIPGVSPPAAVCAVVAVVFHSCIYFGLGDKLRTVFTQIPPVPGGAISIMEKVNTVNEYGELLAPVIFVMVVFLVVQFLGQRMIGGQHRPFVLRLAILGIGLVNVVTALTVIASGTICLSLGDAASHAEKGVLPGWADGIYVYFGVLVIGSLIALVRAARWVLKSALGFNVA